MTIFNEYTLKCQTFYSQHKYVFNICSCLISFAFVWLHWFDLSLITNFYFLGLTYMTVGAVGNFFVELSPFLLKQTPNQQSLITAVTTGLELERSQKILLVFLILANNWLIYSSLVIINWIILMINSLIGGGYVFGPILLLYRYLLHMCYCKEIIKLLAPCTVMFFVDTTYISDDLAISGHVPVYVKHLINLILINNVFCYNLFAKVNLQVLLLIEQCSCPGIDIIYEFVLKLLED